MEKSARVNYYITAIATIGICYLIYAILAAGPVELQTIIGLAITIPSVILLVVARVRLGSSFAVTAQAKHLITTGIYSKIRHPVYLFAQLMLFGLALCAGRIGYFVLWILLLVIQLFRAKKEEKVLEERFGDAYRAYKKTTWF